MKTAKRALSLLLSLLLVLGAAVIASADPEGTPEPVNTRYIYNGDTELTMDYYDDGTVYISGSGVLPSYTFDDETSIKKIIFAEDCAISKIESYAFKCFNSISALTDVEIKSTVPLSIEKSAFVYEGETVNFMIKAPGIESLSEDFINSNGAKINVVFDSDDPLLLNPGVFSNMFIGDASVFTVPYGSAVNEKFKYMFYDSWLQEEYSMCSGNEDEDFFWQQFGTGLVEGQDYIKYYSVVFNDSGLQDAYDIYSQDGNEFNFWKTHSYLAEGQDYVFITEAPEPVILTQENKSLIFGEKPYELIIKNPSEYTPPAAGITITSEYTANEYTITYVVDGKKTEVKYNYGAEVSKPASPTKEGFTFDGWDKDIPATMPAENLTITALFSPVPSTEVSEIEFTDSAEILEQTRLYGLDNGFSVKGDIPKGAKVEWYVNGEKAGEGRNFIVTEPKSDYTVQAKLVDADGNVLSETDEANIDINTSFFARLYRFFCSFIQRIIDVFKGAAA